jgi:hypothetical protein
MIFLKFQMESLKKITTKKNGFGKQYSVNHDQIQNFILIFQYICHIIFTFKLFAKYYFKYFLWFLHQLFPQP